MRKRERTSERIREEKRENGPKQKKKRPSLFLFSISYSVVAFPGENGNISESETSTPIQQTRGWSRKYLALPRKGSKINSFWSFGQILGK